MMSKNDSLKEYRKKRDFKKTSEPSKSKKSSKKSGNIFVIQKHDASKLHYDFRLKIGKALKSWAVPKGPSTDPGEKRLAVATEDHPISYADFEGVIPEGEYGAGTVMVWDKGTYKNLKEDDGKKKSMNKSYKDGHITVWLKGKKLKGGYSLIRTGKKSDSRWLLVKMDDNEADARRNPVSSEKKSVKSDRTMKQIEKEEG